VCGPLEAEAASIENEIAFLQQERDALRQSVIYSDPSAIRAELAAYGCQVEPVRGSRPSRCACLRAALRTRRIACAFSRARRSDGFS
jgi:hypothetical protein